MNRILYSRSWAVVFIFIFIFLVSAVSSPAQNENRRPIPVEDTAINPHDFTDEYYAKNGVDQKQIIGRRTGSDGLSVFGESSNPNHRNVRVHLTLPVYNLNSEPGFWYPLGELRDSAFSDNEIGKLARETAKLFPIYIFPDRGARSGGFYMFTATRQAPMIDDWWTVNSKIEINPLGIREVFFVNYTEKAFGKEGTEMMEFFTKKNGSATDGTPIIKSGEDIAYLKENEFISMNSLIDDKRFQPLYIMSPVITDPTKGAIAKDAFIWMATNDGKPLPTEEMFTWQFGCLKDTGEWCKQ